jgi:hypothetical protein
MVEKPVKKRGFIEYERGAAAYKVPKFYFFYLLYQRNSTNTDAEGAAGGRRTLQELYYCYQNLAL